MKTTAGNPLVEWAAIAAMVWGTAYVLAYVALALMH
jgi:hypothetical protein